MIFFKIIKQSLINLLVLPHLTICSFIFQFILVYFVTLTCNLVYLYIYLFVPHVAVIWFGVNTSIWIELNHSSSGRGIYELAKKNSQCKVHNEIKVYVSMIIELDLIVDAFCHFFNLSLKKTILLCSAFLDINAFWWCCLVVVVF